MSASYELGTSSDVPTTPPDGKAPKEDLRRFAEAADAEIPSSSEQSPPSCELPTSSAEISEEAEPPPSSEMSTETGAASVSDHARRQWDTHLESVRERSPVEHHHLAEIDGRSLWVPNDYEQMKDRHFLQQQGFWNTEKALGLRGTCLPSILTITAGIYLDPEGRNPHYKSEDTMLAAGLEAGAFDIERFHGGAGRSASFMHEESRLYESFKRLAAIFDDIITTSEQRVAVADRMPSSSPVRELQRRFLEFDTLARSEFLELESDMVYEHGFLPWRFLEELGLPMLYLESTTAEDLAAHPGKVAMLGVDADSFWYDSPENPIGFQERNHSVLSLGPAFDGSTGERAGLLFIDTGSEYKDGAGVFRPNTTCEKAIATSYSYVIDQFRPGFRT